MTHPTQHATTRRTLLRTGAAAGAAAALGAAGVFTAGTAVAAGTSSPAGTGGGTAGGTGGGTAGLPYPPAVVDTSHCTAEVAELLRGFFAAKSRHDVPRVMSYFSRANTVYIDANLGTALMSWQQVNDLFTAYFPKVPATALSYPVRIVGDMRSAAVEFVDTPPFFGAELRALSPIVFDGQGKITRWVDYWDGRSALTPPTVIGGAYPTDFKDSEQNAHPAVVEAARALQAAFAAGDAAAAVGLMSADVVIEDLSAHTRVCGRLQAQRYYARALGRLPYGIGAAVLHTEGGRRGGGYEWSAAPGAAPLRRGHTCIELDNAGKVSRLTVIYDANQLSYPAYQSLVGLAAEAPLS
ncbi:hypothetical protein KGQ20_05090 [Catenulispora sp. NF23]|uniref:hypothetical protein n=1 Tax=Catenulispora pinistramenti TaxID=2705254 RepID=UPI001BAB4AC7|nr:hypothetical protein [Catenulispora pinistramenti]MBS2532141.1 hypothetical protein [Catenulispora pinistramenti]